MPFRKEWLERGKNDSGQPIILCGRCHNEAERTEADSEAGLTNFSLYCSHCNVVFGTWPNSGQRDSELKAFITPRG